MIDSCRCFLTLQGLGLYISAGESTWVKVSGAVIAYVVGHCWAHIKDSTRIACPHVDDEVSRKIPTPMQL